MIDVLISYGVITISLLTAQLFANLWLKQRPEFTRKLIHVAGGVVAAALGIYLSLEMVALIAVSGAIAVLVLRSKNILNGLYDVKRKSWGEVLFPLGIALAALVADSVAAYVFGVLVLTIGDTAAAYSGIRYAKTYMTLWGSNKSLVGTAALAVTVVIIAAGVAQASGADTIMLPTSLLLLAAVCSFTELVGINGIDNLTLPLVATLSWNLLV